MDRQRSSTPESLSLLQNGEVLRHQPLPSHNYTLRVELADAESRTCLAIYKPRKGEAPLWDFPPGTLYRREYLAYLVSEALGWGIVPLTVIRDGPFGVGSMQLHIEAQRGMHYFTLAPDHREEMMRIAVFDCIINNCDRKGGHCLADKGGRIWGIDHGLSFVSGLKLRTVMWDLADEPLGRQMKREVEVLCGDRPLLEALSSQLSAQEVQAFYHRVEMLLASPTIPMERLSDPYRPYPWPTI